MRRILLSVVFSFVAAGCVAEGRTTATVAVATPDLVYVAPGVSVIADYDKPIFFADGFYWWFYGNTWYRSAYYTGGWVVAAPPAVVIRIGEPAHYRHYRPRHYVARHRPVPVHRVQRPVVRDHRTVRRDRRR